MIEELTEMRDCCKKVEDRLNYLAGNPGVDEDKGAVGRIEKHLEKQNNRYEKLYSAHNTLRIHFWILVGLLVGAGIITPTLLLT